MKTKIELKRINGDVIFDVDFENSIIVGDKLSDLEAGLRLGMRTVLVKTGHGKEELDSVYFKTEIYNNLYEFGLKLKGEK